MYVCMYIRLTLILREHGQWVWHDVLHAEFVIVCHVLLAEPSTELEPEPERKADESFSDEWCE